MNQLRLTTHTHLLSSLLLLLLCFGRAAMAASMVDITYVETDFGGGNWQYEYTVSNISDPIADTGFDVFDVFFMFDPDATVTVVDLPNDWDAIDGLGFVDAFSLLPGIPPLGADISPETSLNGLVFLFDQKVGDLSFEALLEDPSTPFAPAIFTGTTRAVPEPITLFLLSLSLAGLAFTQRKLET